jgi:hypothetical protein
MVAKGIRARTGELINPRLFSQLRARCNSQQFFRDTATFVHTHPSEAT